MPQVPGVIWVPGERVLLLKLQLPALRAAERRAAVAFAVEDRIAEPLEKVDVVLGPKLADGHLVAVFGRDVLTGYGGTRARLLPDVLALPCPEVGWTVLCDGSRVMVRQADGTGFVTQQDAVAEWWALAGSPQVVLYGGDLPQEIAVIERAALPPPDPTLLRFDLAAGGTAGRGLRLPRGALVLTAALMAAAGLHLAVMAADLWALGKVADAREDALRVAFVSAGQPAELDIETALTRALKAAEPRKQAGFLPLLVSMSNALAGLEVQLRSLVWSEAGGLVIVLEAPDLAVLQTAETELTGAGLGVTSGVATNGDGAAEVQLTLVGGVP